MISDMGIKAVHQSNVVATELDNGETVLLNLDTQKYFTLNETGSLSWRLLGEGYSLGKVSEEIVARYDTDLDRAGSSVRSLVNELAEAGLIKFTED